MAGWEQGRILWRLWAGREGFRCEVGAPEHEAEDDGPRISGTTGFFSTMHGLAYFKKCLQTALWRWNMRG